MAFSRVTSEASLPGEYPGGTLPEVVRAPFRCQPDVGRNHLVDSGDGGRHQQVEVVELLREGTDIGVIAAVDEGVNVRRRGRQPLRDVPRAVVPNHQRCRCVASSRAICGLLRYTDASFGSLAPRAATRRPGSSAAVVTLYTTPYTRARQRAPAPPAAARHTACSIPPRSRWSSPPPPRRCARQVAGLWTKVTPLNGYEIRQPPPFA